MEVIISGIFVDICKVVISELDNLDKSVIISIYNGEATGRKVEDILTVI